ncbi:MAG: hypothetical protein CL666_03845 [Balneola sp.]|nr:hypothetical protein [Balneola sp.]|tara:strand:- start:71451 stop:71954 length:504 start_codon:yes stop_codon:yes gene_type:complete
MSFYYHIVEFEVYCKSCGMLIPNQMTSFSSEREYYSRGELKKFLEQGGQFQCPNCGAIGNVIFTKAVIEKSNDLKFQFILSLRKENSQITWMPIEGLTETQIAKAIDEIKKYLKNNNLNLHRSSFGKGIIIVDFLKSAPYIELTTFDLDGFDRTDLQKIIAYFDNQF